MRSRRLWLAVALVFVAAAFVEAQIDGIRVVDSADVTVKRWSGGIARIKCLATLSCSFSSGELSIGVNSSGGVTLDMIGSGTAASKNFNIGNGSTLTYSGTGIVNANQLKGNTVAIGTLSASDANKVVAVNGSGQIDVAYSGVSVNAVTSTPYAIVAGDRGKRIGLSGSAAAVTIAQATGDFGAGWYTDVCNDFALGGTVITVTPTTSTIGQTVAGTVLQVFPGECARIISDGTNYKVEGLATTVLVAQGTCKQAGTCASTSAVTDDTTTSETAVTPVWTMPANTLGTNVGLRVHATVQTTTTNNAPPTLAVRLRLGGAAGNLLWTHNGTAGTPVQNASVTYGYSWNVIGTEPVGASVTVTSGTYIGVVGSGGSLFAGQAAQVSGVATNAAKTVDVTFQWGSNPAGTFTATLQGYRVWLDIVR